MFVKISDIGKTSSGITTMDVFSHGGAKKHTHTMTNQNANIAKAIEDIANIFNS